MDLFDEITANLKPLGGDLFIDEFVRARRLAVEKREAEKAAAAAAAEAEAEARRAKEAEQHRNRARGPEPAPGRSDDEVAAFMNRDQIEGTDEIEIQEFLKERAGFDPTQLE